MSLVSLRSQIVETQKARSDLMKWKLLLVAALGAAGIGLEKISFKQQHILLALIPFVCVYVDVLCAHLSLRIIAIGEFIYTREPRTDDEKCARDYEKFIRSWPPKYRLEQLALHWSTGGISFLVAAAGVALWLERTPTTQGTYLPYFAPLAMLVSGIIGVIFTMWIRFFECSRREIIGKAAETSGMQEE